MPDRQQISEEERQARQQRMQEIRSRFEAARTAAHQRQSEAEVPERLFHYTTIEGLTGIIKSSALWASDVRYLNDYSELRYATELIEDEFGKFVAQIEDRELAERLDGHPPMYADYFEYFQRPYVACLTERGDLLSQWRGYGRGQAVFSLGLDLRHIATFGDLPPRTFLAKVIYDEPRQRAIVQRRLQDWLTTVQEVRADGYTLDELFPYPVAWELESAVFGMYLVFKHPAFTEEQEWRLIKIIHFRDEANYKRDVESDRRMRETFEQLREMGIDRPDPPSLLDRGSPTNAEGIEIKFRPSSVGLVPYVELVLKDRAGIFTGRLPLKEVVHGPSEHPELSLESLSMFLEFNDYGFHTEVRPSSVPLRF